jgi:hypothetical protein
LEESTKSDANSGRYFVAVPITVCLTRFVTHNANSSDEQEALDH